ncbi:MAG: helix-hairpin-helix domain-containing protein [Anaerolineales bacterium]|nr:helix-hairpin-helix domain-containing protein [Anaerolineales bacterium]MCB8951200.1 helix-hairpin-helix domain-containing protein [Ardenticatenales bacterium]
METTHKLQTIATQMHLEPAEETGSAGTPCGARTAHNWKEELGVFHAALPGGKTIPLLKTMLTTACERNCAYCPFRAGRNYRRTTFKPEEMAQAFMSMNRAGMVQGLFLSSGIIKGGAATQDRLLDTVDILRRQHQFRGYVHLKIMPGAERAQVERAMQLADRLSINLEAPTPQRLAVLAPQKQFLAELLSPLQWVEEMRQTQPSRLGWNGRWPSTVTQFVVGAAGDSDVELLSATEYLYHRLHLSRTYFSAFHPIADTPLAQMPATPLMRQNRLYQASFLLRDYGFDLESLPFDPEGNLPLDRDPKRAWAETALADNPVELNRASREELLQIPGIGPQSANTIVAARRRATLRELEELHAIGLRTTPMAPFVLLDGKRPTYQMRLF